MKRVIQLVLLVVLVFSCTPKNTEFNPFDEEFAFHSTVNLEEYDTISAGCGYFNITLTQDELQTYYQYFEDEIVAKGFDLSIDSYPYGLKNIDFEKVRDSIARIPVPSEKILQKLSVVDVIRIEIDSIKEGYREVLMEHRDGSNYHGEIDVSYDTENSVFVRRLGFFNNGKNK
ncbi:MAG: hypothetical protein OEY34_07635 [Cyclobacteriaceae bacterium]|nr:hypothetical protein [Cyclobacteriaceae bacterium]